MVGVGGGRRVVTRPPAGARLPPAALRGCRGEGDRQAGKEQSRRNITTTKKSQPQTNSLGTEDTNTASTKERKRGWAKSHGGKVQSGEDRGWRRDWRNRIGREEVKEGERQK